MSQEAMKDIIDKAVTDYGFRLAVMWGVDDVISMSDLTEQEASALRSVVVPELKELPDPVEPENQPSEQARIMGMVSGG